MTGVWVGIGAAVGWLTAPPGAIGTAAGVIAGLIVLPPMGVFLGLVGARWRESAVGAAIGAVLAGAYSPAWQTVAFGVLYGGLIGATALPVFYRLPAAVAAGTRAATRPTGRGCRSSTACRRPWPPG